MEELSDAGSIPARSIEKPLISLQIIKDVSGFLLQNVCQTTCRTHRSMVRYSTP